MMKSSAKGNLSQAMIPSFLPSCAVSSFLGVWFAEPWYWLDKHQCWCENLCEKKSMKGMAGQVLIWLMTGQSSYMYIKSCIKSCI